jgi:hypothetical protein
MNFSCDCTDELSYQTPTNGVMAGGHVDVIRKLVKAAHPSCSETGEVCTQNDVICEHGMNVKQLQFSTNTK